MSIWDVQGGSLGSEQCPLLGVTVFLTTFSLYLLSAVLFLFIFFFFSKET